MLSLPCNHYFCFDCWKVHCLQKIKDGSSQIFCMGTGCRRQLMLSDITMLCGPDQALIVQQRLASVSLSMSHEFKRCINPNCQLSISVESLGLCNVAKCKCGARICWVCGNEAHAPLSCNKIEEWLKTAGNETFLWLSSNTKSCPKCNLRIEKNGGCNHMICSNCQHEFCWICGHDWKTHNGKKYQCNQYIKKDNDCENDEANDTKKDIERISHYCKHYFNHYYASKEERKSMETFKEKMKNSFERSLDTKSENLEQQIQFILETIDEARSVLMWSYPYAYYLQPESTRLNLFEFVQAECEKSLEKLCFNVEYPTFVQYEKAMNLANTTKKNTESLLKHVDLYLHYSSY